ncbi:MAG: mannose-6-phosphate isomerase [Chloroflexi bacterium]|nr:mannose-6-phosphate isomerase [Chloroflexota bacterium]
MTDPDGPPIVQPTTLLAEDTWGHAVQYARNTPVSVKLVKVHAGGVHSLQVHRCRSELWVILDAGLRVEVDGHAWEPCPGDEVWIPAGSTHRVAAPGPEGRFIEVSFGHFSEADVTRLEDAYGRVS